MRRIVIAAALMWAGVAAAEARVAVLGFSGPKAELVRTQLTERLCQEAACVKPGKKGTDTQVDGVVTGKVVRNGKGLTLELKVYTSEDQNPVTVKMPIRDTGKMSEAAVASAVASVHGVIGDGTK